MPDQAARFCRVCASGQNGVNGATLVLAQDGFACFTVLHIEQNPVLERAQEVIALKEGLHSKAVGFFWGLLPACHVAAVGIPRHAVPVVQQVRHVE